MEWIKYIVSILSGLAVAIPLVVKLVEYVAVAVKEKNWNELIKLTMGYMVSAEERFADGAAKKDWVMSMVIASADTINYDLDELAVLKIDEMIDSICAAAKTINTV